MTDPQRYGILLSDGEFGDEVYGFHFSQRELADWIEAPVDFPAGSNRVRISIPGHDRETLVTIGSSANDKLLCLGNCVAGRPHGWLTEIEEHYDTAKVRAELVALCGEANIYEGLIY